MNTTLSHFLKQRFQALQYELTPLVAADLDGTTHDRDVNAAMNILALGHERLAVGITASLGR